MKGNKKKQQQKNNNVKINTMCDECTRLSIETVAREKSAIMLRVFGFWSEANMKTELTFQRT